MIKKMSRKQFIKCMEGKRVTLVLTNCVTEYELKQAIKSLEHENVYHTFATATFNEKYTGVFHGRSHGFYRENEDGTKSYKDFDKGSYIMSDGKITFIYTPDTMRVCVYRLEQ